MALIMGDSVYKTCCDRGPHPQLPQFEVACPFYRASRHDWCRACLLAEIQRLEAGLDRVVDLITEQLKKGR